MDLLIGITDIQAVRDVSSNITTGKRVNQFIEEAQMHDLRPWLGDGFFFDLIKNAGTAPYPDLLNGDVEFENCNKETVVLQGLKKVIAYYAYARLIINNDAHVTATGNRQKMNDYSEQLSSKKQELIATQARNNAETYARQAIEFLNIKKTDYPLWKRSVPTNKTRGGIRISSIAPND